MSIYDGQLFAISIPRASLYAGRRFAVNTVHVSAYSGQVFTCNDHVGDVHQKLSETLTVVKTVLLISIVRLPHTQM